MKHISIIFLTASFLLSACGVVPGKIEVHNAWARPSAQGENAAIYFTIHNHSSGADELIGASSDMADNVEIHESKSENDIVQMTMLTSLPLGADEEIIFAPGGLHIMLVNINQEFKLGEHIGLILHFKNHEDLVVDVHIEDAVPEEDHSHP